MSDFIVKPGIKVDLREWPTRIAPFYDSESGYKKIRKQGVDELRDLQKLLYAANSHALLLVFQAMDAAGKDSAIKNVMSGVNPQGCQVFSFKKPSEEELEHDFLWRTQCRLPERGRIGIFNRSYYEEVLVVKVRPELLAKQGVDPQLAGKAFWKGRYRSIADSERHLHRNGTRIVKFFLHLSKEEQRKRLLARIEDPDKNWKISPADIAERGRWEEYMSAYEACMTATSTPESPWHIIPADDKKNAQLIISAVLRKTLAGLEMSYPELTLKALAGLKEMRSALVRESPEIRRRRPKPG